MAKYLNTIREKNIYQRNIAVLLGPYDQIYWEDDYLQLFENSSIQGAVGFYFQEQNYMVHFLENIMD